MSTDTSDDLFFCWTSGSAYRTKLWTSRTPTLWVLFRGNTTKF